MKSKIEKQKPKKERKQLKAWTCKMKGGTVIIRLFNDATVSIHGLSGPRYLGGGQLLRIIHKLQEYEQDPIFDLVGAFPK